MGLLLKIYTPGKAIQKWYFCFFEKFIFWSKRVFLDFFWGSFLDKFRYFAVGDLYLGIYVFYVTILKCVLGIFEKVYILAEKGF